MTTQALTGIRILDFTQVLAGPFATQQLAQLGAEVIKVEQPGTGDMTRGMMSASSDGMAPSFLTCNLGKRSLTLDLKHPSAREIIQKLIDRSDVLVENFKPGTIERLGFGYEAVKAIKPDIIYASVSGYGQSGPKSELPAFDGAIQAASGMMSISGHAESGPTRTGYFSVDMSTAINAAFAITAALLRRQRTGEGQRVDVAMMDTAMMMQAPQMTAYLTNGTVPELLGNRSPTKQPTSNVFSTADGYVQVAAMKESQVQDMLTALGHPGFYNGNEDPSIRVKNTDAFNALLFPIFKSKPTEHWLKVLAEAGVPSSPIRDYADNAADEQFDHRLTFTETQPTGKDAPLKVVSASHTSQPAPPVVQSPPPQLGEHTDQILTELGYTPTEIESLKNAGAI